MNREHVFPDGVKLGDVLDAISAAGAAEHYAFANDLRVKYTLNVCCGCGTALLDPEDAVEWVWVAFCDTCSYRAGLAAAKRWAASLRRRSLPLVR
jgi:hypothetical protein